MADTPLFGQSATSPNAVAYQRALAQQLSKQGMDTSPIRSPWQGVARLAQSAAGGYQSYQADQAELAARQKAAANLAAALKGNDMAGAIGAMSDPFTNPEAAKTVAGMLTPQRVDVGMGTVAVDRYNRPIEGTYLPKQQIVQRKLGEGVELPQVWEGTGPGGGYRTVAPAQPMVPAGGPSQPGASLAAPGMAQPPAAAPSVSPQDQADIAFANTNAANKARMKTGSEEGAKAAMAPVGEIMKEVKTAPQALNALNIIEDTMRQYGGSITTGPAGEPVLKLKQAVNGLMGSNVLGDTAPAEIIKKLNAQLASASLPAFTQRGTQFDLKVFMENNPGLSNSPQGTLFLTNILKQTHRQNLQLAQLAQDPANWSNWPAVQQKFYQDNPILNPLTQRPMGMATDTAQQKGFTRDQLEAEARRRGLLK